MAVLLGGCSDAKEPPVEVDRIEGAPPAAPAELAPDATRPDTVAWLEETLWGDAFTTVYRDTVPSCATCEVHLVPVGGFGDPGDEVLLIDTPIRVVRDSRGRFHATAIGWAPEVIVYEPDGSIVRKVGREGEGPGEFQFITDILIGPGDSLFVAHDFMRFSVFDSAGVVAETRLLETQGRPGGRVFLVGATDDEVILSYTASQAARESVLHPFHAFDRTGAFVRSYGPLGFTPLVSRGPTELPLQSLGVPTSPGSDGALWIATARNYRLERVDEDGRVDRVIGVESPDAWRNPLRMSLSDPEGVMRLVQLLLIGFHQINDELGVALLHVPSPNWEEVELRRHPRYPDDRYAPEIWQELRDSVIDVIHIPTGDVLARKRIPEPAHLTRDGALYTVTVGDDGVIRVEVFEIEVTGFEGAPPS